MILQKICEIEKNVSGMAINWIDHLKYTYTSATIITINFRIFSLTQKEIPYPLAIKTQSYIIFPQPKQTLIYFLSSVFLLILDILHKWNNIYVYGIADWILSLSIMLS